MDLQLRSNDQRNHDGQVTEGDRVHSLRLRLSAFIEMENQNGAQKSNTTNSS